MYLLHPPVDNLRTLNGIFVGQKSEPYLSQGHVTVIERRIQNRFFFYPYPNTPSPSIILSTSNKQKAPLTLHSISL